MKRLAAFVVAAFCVATTVACDVGGPPSKVALGQRYSSGEPKYDGFFESVHQHQVSAATWSDERKAARRPVVATLALTPDATDAAIVQATRERSKPDAALSHAVEETVRAETDRVRKLKGEGDKLDELGKTGDSLKASVAEDLKSSRDKAREVRRELSAATEALASLARDARRTAKGGEDFVADLGAALDPKAGAREAKPAPKSRPDKTAKPEPPKAPPPKGPEAKRPVEAPKKPPEVGAPKPAEKPPAKPPEEVFTP